MKSDMTNTSSLVIKKVVNKLMVWPDYLKPGFPTYGLGPSRSHIDGKRKKQNFTVYEISYIS